MTKTLQGSEFDAEELKKKYDAERDKRLRSDGNQQYVQSEGEFAHYREDPYTERVERAPISLETEVVIVGGGFGGLLAAARLHEAGIDDVRIIEKAGDFGGTWYWNRYPGAACDTESYVYLPLLEEIGYMPTEKYARAPEIAAHAKAIGEKFDLYPKTIFQTEIQEMRWDDAISRWIVKTDRGDDIKARFVVLTTGHFREPRLPGIPGVADFKGHSFHTSRWDYDYTGGDCLGGLVKLQDKRVGIIGTGATAVQCVPHLGQWSKQLYVFQRTPSSCEVRGDRPTDPAWVETLTPGWQKRRMDNFTYILGGVYLEEDQVNDSWTQRPFMARHRVGKDATPEQIGEIMQLADVSCMESVRARVEAIVENKETAEALKPWYNRLCKRPCFHDDYLPTFNRPNVTLVDTAGKGVDRITEDGVIVAGIEYKIDCLIYATGFGLAPYSSGVAMPVYGRNGLSLEEKWRDGATTLHGVLIHEFPNLMISSTTQSAWGPNFLHMTEELARHIAYIVKETKDRGAKTVELTAQAEQDWVKTHEDNSEIMVNIWKDCTPSYFNNEGKMSPVLLRNGSYGGGVMQFANILETWRNDGDLKGLDLVPETPADSP